MYLIFEKSNFCEKKSEIKSQKFDFSKIKCVTKMCEIKSEKC